MRTLDVVPAADYRAAVMDGVRVGHPIGHTEQQRDDWKAAWKRLLDRRAAIWNAERYPQVGDD